MVSMSIFYVQSIHKALFLTHCCCGKIRSLPLSDIFECNTMKISFKKNKGIVTQTIKRIHAIHHACNACTHTNTEPVKHCPQTLCLPIITACSAVAFSSAGQIKHRLWWELLLFRLQDVLFQLRLFSTPPTALISLFSSGCGSCDGRNETSWGFKHARQTHKGQVSFTLIEPVSL